MNLADKQITFRKPTQVSRAINEGLRAVAERYDGRIGQASDHCLDFVAGLTEARLTRSRANKPPRYTRDGASFITLIWVLLTDGMLPYRPAAAREWFVTVLEATDLFEESLTEDHLPQLVAIFTKSLRYEMHQTPPEPESITQTLTQLWTATTPSTDGNNRLMPIFNRLFVGRDADAHHLRVRIGIEGKEHRRSLTIVRGWPGVGKTALVNRLIHNKRVQDGFADGILWEAFGQDGDVVTALKSWARDLGARHLLVLEDIEELQIGLRAALGGRDILIVADDIWDDVQGQYIKNAVDLKSNTLLMTTRFTDVAKQLQDVPADIYVLEPLSEDDSIALLSALAPEPVKQHRGRMPELVKTVEGLPLALRVAGPLLQHYHNMGFDVNKLIDEFASDYNRLLKSTAPSDRFDEKTGKTPTIELLFKRSVETLPHDARLAFAALGVFEHKPATFDMQALKGVWTMDGTPETLATTLTGRGLMEVTDDKRFRVHQTLHMYANKLLDDYEKGLDI